MVDAVSPLRFALGLFIALPLVACTGGASQSSPTTGASQYTVGGSVSGLKGSGLVLQNQTGDSLPISADGPFTFQTTLTSRSAYYVLTAHQPVGPNQTCVVGNPTGAIGSGNVSNINVVCTDKSDTTADTIGVTISGVGGSGLVLQNNGADNLSVTADGSFTFPLTIPDGSGYDVSVLSPPIDPYQDCVVSNGSGTTSGSDIGNVVVSCTVNNNPRHSISGTITGISGSIVLQDNGRDDLTVTADGTFQFPLKIPQGSVFDVSTKSVAGGQSQTCQFQNARGVVADHDITDVVLTCNANISLKVAVSGLSGTGLVLQNNGGDNLSVSANGTTSFPTPLIPGGTYAVTVAAQPTNPSQTCVVSNGTGTAAAGAIASLTCTTDQFAIAGSVTGLPDPTQTSGAKTDLVLQDNLGDDVTIPVSATSPVAFTFPTTIASGSSYSVTVKTQPGADFSAGTPGVTQTSTVCVVSGGAGTVTNSAVTNIVINCVRPSGFAYVTNGTDNTVAEYVVDRDTGLLLPSGTPVPTGTNPSCAAVYDSLYICNRGSDDLSVYAIDPNAGVLTQTPGSPVSAGLTAPTSAAFTSFANGPNLLYVTNSLGAATAGTVAAFQIGATAAALTSINQLPTGAGPTGGFVYFELSGSPTASTYETVLNSADNSLSLYRINSTDGALIPVQGAVPTGPAPRDIEHHFGSNPATGNPFDALYVANSGDGTISTYIADRAAGTLAQQGQAIGVGAGLNSLVITGFPAYLYATASQGVFGFNFAPDGSLKPFANNPVTAGAGPGAAATLNNYVYVVNQTDETVSVFSSGTGGVLTPVVSSASIKTGHGPTSIVVVQRPFFGSG